MSVHHASEQAGTNNEARSALGGRRLSRTLASDYTGGVPLSG